ncbi:MAG: GNAT family N-acetyltransferase [Flavobacteriales bacterium]
MRIIEYEPRYRSEFKRINVAWIAKRFEVEDVDLEVLDRPEEKILALGGRILLALEGDEVAGTCALLNAAPGVYQLAKMAVDEPFRGAGIGRALCEAGVEIARQLGATKVMLYSNTKGSAAAVQLYRKLGFRELPLPTQAYLRADIYMELMLH